MMMEVDQVQMVLDAHLIVEARNKIGFVKGLHALQNVGTGLF